MVFARSVAAVAVVLVAFSSAVASKKYAEAPKCYEKGERCAGADHKPYVEYLPCCDKHLMCVEDEKMGWGRFCKKPSDEYWEKCYIEGARCEGAPGKPYVEYHKCCGKAECVKDKKMGWGKFCKGGKYDKSKYEYHKKEEKKGDYYESKDGHIKYETHDKKKVYKPEYKPAYKKPEPPVQPPTKKYDDYAYYKKPEKYDYKKYGDYYGAGKGKLVKGKGTIAGPIEPKFCRLGGGVIGAGCGDRLPNPAGAAIFYITIRVPGCKGGFPCNAAILLRNRICGGFPSAPSLVCALVGEIFTSRMSVLDRQATLAPPTGGNPFIMGTGAFGTMAATTTTTTTTTGAVVVAPGTVTTTISFQISYQCQEFVGALRAAAVAASGGATTSVLDDLQCIVNPTASA